VATFVVAFTAFDVQTLESRSSMKSQNSFSLLSFLCSLVATAVLLAGCSSNQSGQQPEAVNLVGAGSTFVYPIMSRWIDSFQTSSAGVHINYQSIGSGGGINQVKSGLVDFGASDAALSDDQLKTMTPMIQIPESAGPVCLTYNLPYLKEPLKLSAASLSGIYLGTIKNWDDAALAKDNAGAKLPKEPIVVVHRSDGSGTSSIFTSYLDVVNPEWHSKVGKGLSVNWPVGLGGKGSEGVTGVIKQTPGAIGYVELSYAAENNLPVVNMKNNAGNYVSPSADAATIAIDAFSSQLAQDVRIPTVNPPASAAYAYPISGLTFLIVPKDGTDRAKRPVLKKFIQYILADGQNISTGLHYSKLPSSLQQLDVKLLDQMTVGGQTISAQ
jgi:phosphate transport system substrate-binding protein